MMLTTFSRTPIHFFRFVIAHVFLDVVVDPPLFRFCFLLLICISIKITDIYIDTHKTFTRTQTKQIKQNKIKMHIKYHAVQFAMT